MVEPAGLLAFSDPAVERDPAKQNYYIGNQPMLQVASRRATGYRLGSVRDDQMEAKKPMLNKWKRAVLHLEGAADSVDLVSEKLSRHAERLRAGELTPQQFSDILSSGQRDLRYQGTAIFIIHAKRRYLITARHVVWDETSAKREVEKAIKQASRKSGEMRLLDVQMAQEWASGRIFHLIFRVPSLDEVAHAEQRNKFLMNLGAGVPGRAPYTFSEPQLDLAVISLDSRDRGFADELQQRGYEPVCSDEITGGLRRRVPTSLRSDSQLQQR